MAIKLKDDKLTFTVKISRELHDDLDKIREEAKKNGAVYDPSLAVEKALKKDIASSRKDLSGIKTDSSKRSNQ